MFCTETAMCHSLLCSNKATIDEQEREGTREGEGEAPAEPWRRKLGRSLALPTQIVYCQLGEIG